MSGKKISITGLTLLLVIGMFYFLFNSKAEIIPEAEKIYLETMNKSGHAERVSIDNPDDVETLKKIFSKKTTADRGFIFAEGGYRITFETEKEILHLYPYCGNLDTIRVGEEGDNYYNFEGEPEKVEKLMKVLGKYCNLKAYRGIYTW